MAILQSSLSEEVLNRSERAVIRSIYHASQLNESIVALDKAMITLSQRSSTEMPKGESAFDVQTINHAKSMRNYLVSAMQNALVNTKVPAAKPVVISTTPEQE